MRTNQWGKIFPVVWLHAPFPLVLHVRGGNSLDASLNRDPVKIVSVDPHGIQRATHVADLVFASLEGADSVGHEDPEEIVSAELAPQKIIQNTMYDSEFRDGIGRVILEVELR